MAVSPAVPVHPNQIPKLSSHDGIRVREDVLYANHKGKEKRGIRKRTQKALTKLQEPLNKVLEPDEAVLYVTCTGYGGLVEQFVFTNSRLLFFLVKRDGSWNRNLTSIRWGDLAEAEVKGLLVPSFRLKFHNGEKVTHSGLRGEDAKKIKVLFGVLLPASLGEATEAQAMASHCPQCLAALTPGVSQCGQCGFGISIPGSAWSPNAISFICFFFTFLPAGIMYAINYERLGYPEKKKLRLLVIIGGFIVFMAAIFLTPDNASTDGIFSTINIGIAIFFYQSQKALFQRHLSRGGKKARIRVPLALSFLWLVVFFGGLYGLTYFQTVPGEEEFNQAAELLNAGEYEQAESIFESLRPTFSQDPALYWNLAVIYLNTGRLEMAKREIEELLRHDPNNEEAKAFLMEIEEAIRPSPPGVEDSP